ncbi:hypothetical protein DdX_12957 [Ditylenchus destructor]|uniref:Uncharacterized protein n=1 Tax=Ditylenchus destructor TaxID=166010 RepID=A0AAD4R366_9BILA|nr:hypothetical protein DdX_12957 [Ditylenchus destructor]
MVRFFFIFLLASIFIIGECEKSRPIRLETDAEIDARDANISPFRKCDRCECEYFMPTCRFNKEKCHTKCQEMHYIKSKCSGFTKTHCKCSNNC